MGVNIDKALTITGWMEYNELVLLASIAKNCDFIIEAGSFKGRSTRAMADNIREGGVIAAVDPWNASIHNSDETAVALTTDESTRHVFYLNNYKHVKNGTIIMTPKRFTELTPFTSPPVDFIFIDADHRYKAVIEDIEHAIKFNPKFLGGHDYHEDWPGVKRAVDEKFGGNIQVEGTIWLTKLR